MKTILFFAQFLFALIVYGQKYFELNFDYTIELPSLQSVDQGGEVKIDSLKENFDAKLKDSLIRFIVLNHENNRLRNSTCYNDAIQQVALNQREQADVGLLDSVVDFSKVPVLSLHQEWYYNILERKLDVYVTGISPHVKVYDEKGILKGWKPAYYNRYISSSTFLNPNRIVADTSVVWGYTFGNRIPIDYHKIEDISGGSLKKCFNMELPQILFELAKTQQIEVYNPLSKEKMSLYEIMESNTVYDTLHVAAEDGQIYVQGVMCEGNYIGGPMKINQTYFFDPVNFIVTSRINSIIVCRRQRDRVFEMFEVRFLN
jgi:hypothetical protein